MYTQSALHGLIQWLLVQQVGIAHFCIEQQSRILHNCLMHTHLQLGWHLMWWVIFYHWVIYPHVENVKLSMCWEFPKTFKNSKKKLRVTILKINSLYSLHVMWILDALTGHINIKLHSTLSTMICHNNVVLLARCWLFISSAHVNEKKPFNFTRCDLLTTTWKISTSASARAR